VRRIRQDPDAGAATVEFVFVGVLVLVPLLYLVLAVFEVQRNAFAVTEAAREAGRAFATADTPETASARAAYAVQLALTDQGLNGGAELRWGVPGNGCAGPAVRIPATGRLNVDSTVSPPLAAGSEFEVCVVRSYRVPGVPGVLDAGRNTVTARYVVHVGRLRGFS
jgi:Flp pilus assembly protein TadG